MRHPMSNKFHLDLDQGQCELIALSLDALLGTTSDPEKRKEIETLFMFFDTLVDPLDEERDHPHVPPRHKIHLIYDRDSNVFPLFRK